MNARVAGGFTSGDLVERVRGDAREVGEVGRQVDEGEDHAGHGGDAGREVEGPVDRGQAVLAGPGPGEVDTGDRGECTDGGDQQRVDEALVAEGLRAEDQRGDQGHGVRLEQVGRHAGAVADVVTDVVGDGRGVARVVLGDVLLDLADQVGADVGGLGEDAAADPHEHGEQGGTEAEALEHVGCLVLEDQHHELAPSRPRPTVSMPTMAPVRRPILIAGSRPPARWRPRRRAGWRAPRATCRGSPTVAEKPGADEEEHGPEDPDGRVVGGQREEREERQRREDRESAELSLQVGVRALLHGQGDVLHVVRALAGGQDLGPEHRSHTERAQRDQCDDDDQDEVATGKFDDSGIDPGHAVSSMRIRCELDWPRWPSPDREG